MLEREWINGPGPVFRSRAQAGDYRILPDVIEFCCKLSAAFVSTHPMIKIPFLPNDVIDSVMKTSQSRMCNSCAKRTCNEDHVKDVCASDRTLPNRVTLSN